MISFKPLKNNLCFNIFIVFFVEFMSQSFNVSANIGDELCVNYSDGSIMLQCHHRPAGSYSYTWTGPNSCSSTS